ncbi:hypothetical protein [Sphingobium herbicidovorans]
MADLHRIADLLEDLIEEIRGLRNDFNEFTGYNTTKMRDAVDDLGDRIAGGFGGVGGASLDDIKVAVESVENAVDLK